MNGKNIATTIQPTTVDHIKDTKVVGTSLVVSISDVLLNVLVALFTGSVVMLSQALQGTSDLITAGLLYHGVRSSKRSRDERHHFGYGREIFFWVIIAGIFMFFGTGLLSIWFGVDQIINPGEISNVPIALIMLVFGLTTNAYAFSLSVKRLEQADGDVVWWKKFLHSTMVETKATFLIDFLGTAAALIGLFSLSLLYVTGNADFDGIGSIIIGLSMMVGSLLLIFDVKDLIVGRAVPNATSDAIRQAAVSIDKVNDVLDLRTMYIGSSRLLIIIEVHLQDELDTDSIEKISDDIKQAIKTAVPQAHTVQVEIETPDEELNT